MQVRCMANGDANRGVIEKEACLQCALANGTNTPCGFDYILLKYLYSKERYEQDKVHVSDILGCARQAYFSKKYPLPVNASKELIVSFGTLQHQMLEEMVDEHYEAEKVLSNSGLVGTADVYYKNGRILDYKTTRNIKKQYLPQKKHKLQVNVYAHMLREEGYVVTSAAIQYIDFMGPSKCEKCKAFVVPGENHPKCPICGNESKDYHLGAYLANVALMDDTAVEELIASSTASLQKFLDEDIVPDASADFLCRYCKFIDWCAEGLKTL